MEQSRGEEGWIYVIPVEQLTVKEFVSTFLIKNFGNFSYHSWHFTSAKLVVVLQEKMMFGFLVLLFLSAFRGAGLSVHGGLPA